MLKKKKVVQKEKNEKLSEEYSEILKNKYEDTIIKKYIAMLKIQYDEKTLNQELLAKLGYLKTLYHTLKYELHYCQIMLKEEKIKNDNIGIEVYNKYLAQYNEFLYIISRLIILEKAVEERKNRRRALEKILPKKEVEKRKSKYVNSTVEFDYNFELCLKAFSSRRI